VRAHFVSREAEDEEELDLAEQTERLFRSRGVRLRTGYDGFLVIEEDGGVIAAASMAPDFGSAEVEFSLVVAPDRERQGLARLLVGEVVRWSKGWALSGEVESDEVTLVAEVINEKAIPPLLMSLGFEHVERNVWRKSFDVRGR
jgi:GNAT superfamily N-acetyltransferase